MKSFDGKRKIVNDRNYPGSEQINKYQDLDRIYKDHSLVQKLMLKKTLAWTGAAVLVAGIATLIYMNSGNVPVNITAANENPVETKPCVQPPVPGAEKPYTAYRISAKNGGILNYETGSSVIVPANAFHLPNGEKVSDSVDIAYREFHSPLDIFLSGIPMHYDSAGLERTLESAGMIEIRAYDKGRALQINDNTQIDIKMASSSNDSRFNLYELDTLNSNWIYKGKDKIEKTGQQVAVGKKENDKTKNIAADRAIKPVMADPQKFSFKVRYDKGEFHELAAYDNVMFEVTDNTFKPAYYKIKWKNISLQKSDRYGDYLVKLDKADTTILVNARPVFEEDDYGDALRKFEERRRATNQALEAEQVEEQKAVEKVNKELATYNRREITQAAFNVAGVTVTFRRFSVVSFGYHNIDCPLSPALAYAYKLASGNRNRNASPDAALYSDIYLVEKGKNTVFRFAKGEAVRCNPKAENLMWTMTNSNQVAFFRITDYKKLVIGGETNIEPVVAANQDAAFIEIRNFSL